MIFGERTNMRGWDARRLQLDGAMFVTRGSEEREPKGRKEARDGAECDEERHQ